MRVSILMLLGALALPGCQHLLPTSTGQADQHTSTMPGEVLDLVDVLQRVSFPAGSAAVTPTSRDALNQAARLLSAAPRVRVEVRGRGDQEGERSLGLARGIAVQQYLVSRGLASERVVVAPPDATEPLLRGRARTAWGQARRVEFRVVWGPEPGDISMLGLRAG